MLKNIFAMLMGLSFVATAHAGYELQINGSFGSALAGVGSGTEAAVILNDNGTTDSTDYGLGAEIYFGMSEQLQIGGLFGYADGDSFADAALAIGGLVRYNLASEMRDSIFVGGGVRYIDFGAADNIAVLLTAGKRFAISETLTWTPNLSVALNVAGDLDEGHSIVLNLISFSGFME